MIYGLYHNNDMPLFCMLLLLVFFMTCQNTSKSPVMESVSPAYVSAYAELDSLIERGEEKTDSVCRRFDSVISQVKMSKQRRVQELQPAIKDRQFPEQDTAIIKRQ